MALYSLPENEDDRLATLKSYNILDTPAEQDFDELTFLASAICGTPIALISLIDEKRQWFKSKTGLVMSESPREESFCTHTINGTDVMMVDDATRDPRFYDNPFVTGDENVVFYAGVPLINDDGFALGTLCVIDRYQKTLTEQQISSLKILAKSVLAKMELRKKIAHLEKANQDLRDANIFVQKFASMAAHDIKNPVSSILLTSQALKIRLEKLQDRDCGRLVDLNINSIKSLMVLLDEMLAYSKTPSLLLAKKKKVNLNALLKAVITLVNIPENFDVEIPADDIEVILSVVAFEQIFINLLSNAVRYNNKELGNVKIRFAEDDEHYRFEIEDNGIGISEQYHDKIFHNNFTLKITDRYNNKGTGIGLSTVKDLVTALKGTIFVKSIMDVGTTFFIMIKK